MRREFLVPSDLSEVQRASSAVLSFLKGLPLDEAALFDIRLCLEEGLINAMKYGHRLKRDLKVRMVVEINDDEIRILLEDQGPGFDVKSLKDCTQSANLLRSRGRGVYLIHQLMDKVQYNEKGNRLCMVKYLKPKRSKEVSWS